MNLAPQLNAGVSGDAQWELIRRIAESPHFKASARLREFLFYIADCAIRNAPEEATEQQVGYHVFNRTPGYNSSEDSIVRTHARLLRQKLAAYFAEDGATEPVILEIPKGHYLPVFRPREPDALVTAPEPHPVIAPVPAATVAPRSSVRSRLPSVLPLVLLCLVALETAALVRPWIHRLRPPSSVDRFWNPYFADDPPLVVFSNALFVGDSKSGLSYARQTGNGAKDESANFVDTYTGIGELAAIYTLTRLFDEHHARFELKRSRLMTWDEAKVKNLIFIGSTAENASLDALQSKQDFSITANAVSAGVVNHHPKPGEPALYSRPEHPLTRDYAILAMLPGMQSGERILIFSGLTTFGTQAAVEFVCHPDTASELLRQISGPKGQIRPFEALIETNVTGGVPVQPHLVTVHVH